MKKLLIWLGLLGAWTAPAAITVTPGGGGSDSNTVYNIALVAANAVGGATNGISQATASAMMADGTNSFAGDGSGLTNLNAAMLSGQVSTNNLTTTKTNWDVKNDFTLDTTAVNPQQVKNFKAALYNREKVVMSFVGDSVGQDVQPIIELALLPFMGRAGAIAASTPSYLGNYFYAGAPTGTTTPYATGLDGVFWGAFSALGNGAVQTVSSELSNGIVATVVGMAWVGWSGGGSMLVETQAYSGSWGTIGTLNSGGTTFQMHTTNWTVPLTNYLMRVTATGSNLPVSFALTDRGTGAGFISSATTTPGMYPIQRMQSAGSNNVATYLLWQNPDVVFYKAERADTALTEVPWFNAVLSNTLPNCDLVLIAYHENTDPVQSYTNRQNFITLSKQMGRAFIDNYAESTPYQDSLDAGLYNVDEVHLIDVGRAVLHGRVPTQLGIGLDGMLALNYPLPSGSFAQTNDTTKANLAGGNTFTGVQRSINDTYFGGFVNTTNGVILWGANADLALRNKDSQVQQALINYKTAIRFQESVTSYKTILSISNDVGTPTLSYDPTGYNPPNIGLIGTPWGKGFFASVISTNHYGSGAGLTNVMPNIGSNSVAITPNITIYLTNQDGTVYRLSAQKL